MSRRHLDLHSGPRRRALPLFLALALGGSLWLRRRSAGANQPQDDEPYQA